MSKIRHWIVVLLILVVLLVLVNLRIDSVTVFGNKTYSDPEAAALVFGEEERPRTLGIIIDKVLRRKKDIPFVADYEIELTGPTSCELIIYEQNPIACVRYVSSYMYFDSDGVVLESSDTLMEGIPVVEGLDFGHIVLHERLPLADDLVLQDVLLVTQQSAVYGEQPDIIRLDSMGEITLVLDGGDIEVELGTNEDISVKISVMSDMLPEIRGKGLKGVLDLRNYEDSAESQLISFKIRD